MAASCLSLAFSAVSWAGMASLSDVSRLWFWYNAATVFWLIPTPLIVHFMLALSRRERLLRNRWFLSLLYLPTVCFVLKTATGPFLVAGFTATQFGWTPILSFTTAWSYGYVVYTAAFPLLGLVSVHIWGKRAAYRTQRIQSRIIFYSGIITLLLGITFVKLGQLAELFWITSIGVAVIRFNLMSPTLVSAARDILFAMSEGIILLDRNSMIIDVNPKTTQIIGRNREDMIGRPISEFLPRIEPFSEEENGQCARDPALENGDLPLRDSEGSERHVNLSSSPVIDRFGEPAGTVVLIRDVTDLIQAEERLTFMATHDPLTNLPNRFLLNDRLRMGIAQAHRSGLSLGVMLIDLDNFKTVNDTYGHETGDKLLHAYAERLLCCLRANDTLARMGGDEFVALLTDVKHPEDPEIVARRILSTVGEPFPIDDLNLVVTSSIGISVYPQDADSIESLLRNADLAMYGIKDAGKNGYRYYTEVRVLGSCETDAFDARSLGAALDEHQFELYYQPVQAIQSDTLICAEALLRWHHPKLGLLTAGAFIDATEQAGLSTAVGEWVIRSACEQRRVWKETGNGGVPIAVNISVRHFQADDFASRVESIIRDFRLDPGELLIELTESAALKNPDRTLETMRHLVRLGIRIIIDEFGAGFSSLQWLKSMPIHALKIDRALIQHIEGDANNMAVVRAMIALAHGLGIDVIAGGVETKEQADALSMISSREPPSVRCDGIQGFFLDRPMPASRFEARFYTDGAVTNTPSEL